MFFLKYIENHIGIDDPTVQRAKAKGIQHPFIYAELAKFVPLGARGAALRGVNGGATRVVIGTAAEPSMLVRLPRERVIVAVDAWNDEVVVEGATVEGDAP